MQVVHDADDGVIDGHKPRVQCQRGFASAFEVDQFAGASGAGGVAGDERFAFWAALLVERLNPEEGDAFKPLVNDARRQGANDLAQQHQETSSPSSSRGLLVVNRVPSARCCVSASCGRLMMRCWTYSLRPRRKSPTSSMAAWTSCSSPLKRLMALPDISYSASRSSIRRTLVPLSASSVARTLAETVSVSRIATASCVIATRWPRMASCTSLWTSGRNVWSSRLAWPTASASLRDSSTEAVEPPMIMR